MTQIDRERFWANALVGHDDECWPWVGSTNGKNRGVYRVNGKMTTAPRVALALAGMPVPQNLCACHRCNNAICVNPAHLYIASNHQNILDSVRDGLQGNIKRDHCIHGHPLTGPNLYKTKDGRRQCRECFRNRKRAARRRRGVPMVGNRVPELALHDAQQGGE